MSYPALAKVLKVAAERAGLSKKVHPHKLRHSRATFLASKLTEAQMNQVFGWKQGSDMPSIYVHLSGRDLDDAILGVYGLRKVEDKEPKLKPKICPRCNTSNSFDARFCMKCGLALDLRAAQEIEEARSKTDIIMDMLLRDAEFRELLKKKLLELG
jgi:ribosomal protein L40E